MKKEVVSKDVIADLRYLQLLSRNFPTIAAASTEIINLEAILNLPKGILRREELVEALCQLH